MARGAANLFLILVALLPQQTVFAQVAVPKLVYLIFEEDRVIASNIKFNRFDEIKWNAKEELQRKAVGNAVAVVVTNQRIMGYSVYTASWRTRRTQAGERIISVEAADYSAIVITSRRHLSFNSRTASWVERPR